MSLAPALPDWIAVAPAARGLGVTGVSLKHPPLIHHKHLHLPTQDEHLCRLALAPPPVLLGRCCAWGRVRREHWLSSWHWAPPARCHSETLVPEEGSDVANRVMPAIKITRPSAIDWVLTVRLPPILMPLHLPRPPGSRLRLRRGRTGALAPLLAWTPVVACLRRDTGTRTRR